MCDIKNLLSILHHCDDESDDYNIILSSELVKYKSELDGFGISYDETHDQIRIDLSTQPIKIYKKKEDCIRHYNSTSSAGYCHNVDDKNILICEEEFLYNPQLVNNNVFFENLIYYRKFRELFKANNLLVSYDDKVRYIFIILSESLGRFDIKYNGIDPSFYEGSYDLKGIYEKLQSKITDPEYITFFRDSILEEAKRIGSSELLFLELLKKISDIYDNSNRDFELYKSKFSFEVFKQGLWEEKEKYFKIIQNNISELLSKINSLSIQFGLYLTAVITFKDYPDRLGLAIIFMLVWSFFSYKSLDLLSDSAKYMEVSYSYVFEQIEKNLALSQYTIKEEKTNVIQSVGKLCQMIRYYKFTLIVVTLLIIGIDLYFINDKSNIINAICSYIGRLRHMVYY